MHKNIYKNLKNNNILTMWTFGVSNPLFCRGGFYKYLFNISKT